MTGKSSTNALGIVADGSPSPTSLSSLPKLLSVDIYC